MIARFFSALGWISMIFSFFILLVSYANYPEEVLVYTDSAGEPLSYLSRGSIFYISLALFGLINFSLVVLRRIFKREDEEKELAQAGLGLTQIFANLFFASSMYFISILNSRENFDYSNFGYMIYLTGTLLTLSVIFTVYSRFILKK